jgi:ATP-dependent DNA ligase
MDAEIVAVNPHTGAIKTFQELSNRAKKDVQVKDIQVSVCLYAFDLMYLNGEVSLFLGQKHIVLILSGAFAKDVSRTKISTAEYFLTLYTKRDRICSLRSCRKYE